ncbi:hypothetical protein CDIV41_230002 [Carnobacterium divergens]|nr:hypothetical protein CDIV41_230002 [Carnobacterium divergens]
MSPECTDTTKTKYYLNYYKIKKPIKITVKSAFLIGFYFLVIF